VTPKVEAKTQVKGSKTVVFAANYRLVNNLRLFFNLRGEKLQIKCELMVRYDTTADSKT
jgi:hypothetical protein